MQAAAAPVFTELIAGADVTIGETVMATGPRQMTWQIPDPPAEIGVMSALPPDGDRGLR